VNAEWVRTATAARWEAALLFQRRATVTPRRVDVPQLSVTCPRCGSAPDAETAELFESKVEGCVLAKLACRCGAVARWEAK
jgi:hypothetical protein